MQCQSCQSSRSAKLTAEVAIHFPGMRDLNTPHLFVFPHIVVCLECGSTTFRVPEGELQSIRERVSLPSRAPREESLVSE
jgi:hypothetical protein